MELTFVPHSGCYNLPMVTGRRPDSKAGELGANLGAAARVFTNAATNKRVWNGLFKGAGAFTRAAMRAGHLLWLEVTGFFFLCFTIIGGAAAWREYRAYAAGKIGPGKAVLAGCFALMFLYFGVSSFWRSRAK